ncbi:MAG: NAD-dependent epimerase/dehydratase family protein [Methylocystis sp.]|nr:NAD-dependent epimerase/dehydratase family protein [Methylocystis sp.]
MNILVIGGAGFLGANLVRFCLEQPGVKLTVMDSLEPELKATTRHLEPVWDKIRFVRASLLDDTALGEVVQDQDIIFNCAGQTSHPLSIQNPLLDAKINTLGNLKLLESVRHLNHKAVVVYTSSSTVVGKAVHDIVDETHPERPLEIYSANKGVAEKYYQIYHGVHGLKTIVLRFANLFGPFGKGYAEFGFINYFISLAQAGDEIRIFGDGAQTRNVLYVEDAARAIWMAAHSNNLVGEICFVVHDEHLSVRDIAAGVMRAMGRGSVTHVPWPDERKRIEVDKVRITAAKFHSLTDWRPRYTFEEGLARTKTISEGTQA